MRPFMLVLLPLLSALPAPAQSSAFDVLHYKLDIKVDPSTRTLSGTNTMTAKSLVSSLKTVYLDLLSNMTVSSVKMGGKAVAFSRPTNRIRITLDKTYNKGQTFTLTVAYRGTPRNSGWGSFGFNYHHGQPIVWSLSEPWFAKNWWPCKDQLGDKSTAEIWLTVPSTLYGVSNGKLMGVDTVGTGWKRFRWQVHYPIIPYLVSLAVSNYRVRTDTFTWKGKKMPLNFYVYPEEWNYVQSYLNRFPEIMRAFCGAYGEYPWMTGVIEKAGIARFPWGGGMEHQTVASQSGYSTWLSAHELSHQWWGDMVTCKTWGDIWLNEGFATFSEALWQERRPGGSMAAYHSYMNHRNRPRTLSGTVYCYNSSSMSAIFSGTNSYDKGSWVLHQLRGVLGDALFFKCLAEYRKTFFGDSATTEDFRNVCERVTGRGLKWFFQEWVYGRGGPYYKYGWKNITVGGKPYLDLTIEQTQDVYGWKVFSMPIQLDVYTSAGKQRVTVWNSDWKQSYTIPVKGRVSSVKLDPEKWILTQGVNGTSYNPMLTASAGSLSAARGGKVTFNLNAGGKAAGRPYLLLVGGSGITPGTPLPGGNLLPLNADSFTRVGIYLVNTSYFQNFLGKLDSSGRAAAAFQVGPGELSWFAGKDLTFAFVTADNLSTVSNAETVFVKP